MTSRGRNGIAAFIRCEAIADLARRFTLRFGIRPISLDASVTGIEYPVLPD